MSAGSKDPALRDRAGLKTALPTFNPPVGKSALQVSSECVLPRRQLVADGGSELRVRQRTVLRSGGGQLHVGDGHHVERAVDAEEARRHQLDALPEVDLDPVAAAYRGTVERILDEVRTARRRVEDDLYGVCIACDGAISAERLQLRPWATACAACASTARR